MKKVFLVFSIAALLVACGGNDNQTETAAETPATENTGAATETPAASEPAVVDLSSNPDYKAGLALEAKSDCATCHKLDEKLVGPSFQEIANKYTNADTTVERLANKIIKGGSGVWGQMAMTPHPQISQDDAKTIVKYILLLKN